MFNFPQENKGSFTVRIQDMMANSWSNCVTEILGDPFIKKNTKGTETDRFWKT